MDKTRGMNVCWPTGKGLKCTLWSWLPWLTHQTRQCGPVGSRSSTDRPHLFTASHCGTISLQLLPETSIMTSFCPFTWKQSWDKWKCHLLLTVQNILWIHLPTEPRVLLGTCSSMEQGGKINPPLSCPPHQHCDMWCILSTFSPALEREI